MDLSVIIVNYNVKHFLAQALQSVEKAMQGLSVEVFVVDNHSVDGSVPFLREHFPWVKLLANRENVGFARANNQAIRQSAGRYVLLLNPDTIVQEDTFRKCVQFMDQTPDAGALGVRMVNGEGRFLPESKRSLPTPRVAFYKIFGLAKLFPKSKVFGRYHLTFLPEHRTAAVEVLSGAFMFLRRETLDKVGLLDEEYFMYGEDVDLSYRITQAGWRNYYYPGTQIVHYKGESTKKGSLNYVMVFYNAMLIFVRKHFSRGQGRWMALLIKLAIYFRAGLSIAKRLVQRAFFPVLEFATLALVFLGIAVGWFGTAGIHPPAAIYPFVSLGYAFSYVFFLVIYGAYRRPFRLRAVVAAVASGLLAVALANYMLPSLNNSRMVVALSGVAAFFLTLFHRGLANYIHSGSFFLDQSVRKRLAIVGTEAEAARVAGLLQDEILYNCEVFGTVLPTLEPTGPAKGTLGALPELREVIQFYKLEEVVFCNASMPTTQIINQMAHLADAGVEFKIVPPQADYLVGPNTILTAHGIAPFALGLHNPQVRVRKAVLDRVVAASLLLGFPISFWVYRRPGLALLNLLKVLGGNLHLVGYIDGSAEDLPRLKTSLLDMRSLVMANRKLQTPDFVRLDRQYARNYSFALDLQICMRGLRLLGRPRSV